MKKTLRIVLICVLVLALAVGVAVAGESLFGFKLGSAVETYKDTVTLTPLTYFDDSASSGYVGGTADVYQDAEKLQVKYTGATEGALYMIYVLKEEQGVVAADARPDEDNIVYINAATATADGVEFTVYQSDLADEKTYNVYLASNGTGTGDIGAIAFVGSYQYIDKGTGENAGLGGKIKSRIALIRNGKVNGAAGENDPYDVNGDGYINESDVSELLDAEE